jgi:large subunit ribosomal protein L2
MIKDLKISQFVNISNIRNLTVALKRTSGRSSLDGHITVRHRGGAHKKRYRKIDFYRTFYDHAGLVLRLERDPNRNVDIALVCYSNGALSYLIQTEGVPVGSFIFSSKGKLPIVNGNAMPLRYVPIGTFVHNVQLQPSLKFTVARAAGAYVQVLKKAKDLTLVRMPSKELRYISSHCLATVGTVGNALFKFKKLYKAGQNRWLGFRPRVRGVAMNPIDHPHGGGQGKTSGGRPSVTPWARLTKGYKTNRTKLKNRFIFKKRV